MDGRAEETEERPGNPFLEASRLAVPRLLSNLNRNDFSPTFGSFDRSWWHYRAVTGFPSATFCQGVLPLALLFKNRLFGASTFGSKRILESAEAALLHWTTLQHSDGSFDEWYSNERSHVATAFTSFAVSEALLLLRDEVQPGVKERVVASLVKAGLWLSKHMDEFVLNHTAGAVPALWNIQVFEPMPELAEGLKRNVALMREKQSEEGWFLENGGFDAGYLSLSIDYLWKYFEDSGDETAREMVERGLGFLDRIVHPDGSSGGEYASRNTRYLMPWGLVATAREFPAAARILARYLEAVRAGRAVTPLSTDDRYMTFFYLPNWMRSAMKFEEVGREIPAAAAPQAPENESRFFPASGLFVRRRPRSYFVSNVRKAGCYRLFAKDEDAWRQTAADPGYYVRDEKGRVYSSQALLPENDIKIVDPEREFWISTSLKRVNDKLPFVKWQVPFLLYSHTIGRFPFVNDLFERTVKNVFIRKPRPSLLRLERRILVEGETIRIEDRLTGPAGRYEVLLGGPSTAPHVPTSRYFTPADLEEGFRIERATLPLLLEWKIDLATGRRTGGVERV